jgi:hypothetical protein
MTAGDDFWDNLFHACAWDAYLEVWHQTGQFPPDSETTRRRAYQLYEEALAAKNGQAVLARPSGAQPLTTSQKRARIGL